MVIHGGGVIRIELIDRGDPAITDLTQAAMTMDGNWYDWDMSAVVPADATWVLLRVNIQDAFVPRPLNFRKNGNVNLQTIPGLVNQVVNKNYEAELLVPCDDAQIIEYMAPGAIALIEIIILGWICGS